MEIYQAARVYLDGKMTGKSAYENKQMIEYTHPAKPLNTLLSFSV